MRLKQVKTLSRVLLAVFVLVIVVGILLDTLEVVLLSFIPLAALYAVTYKFWRCPHCGRAWGRYVPQYCPHCGRRLDDDDLI